MASTNNPLPVEKGLDNTAMERKDSSVVEEGSILEKVSTARSTYNATMSLDPVAERKVVWKFDLRLLPTLAIMYLFNALDKVSYSRSTHYQQLTQRRATSEMQRQQVSKRT